MPPIYVETDNKKEKLYNAHLAGAALASKLEGRIEAMTKKAVDDQAGFTTSKTEGAKGYFIRFKLTKFEASGGSTKCVLLGEIERYPKSGTKSGAKGAEMVNLGKWEGTAEASGTSEGSAMQCVEAIMEAKLPKAFPAMTADMKKR
ncbi:MAG TPA: hypothetical protein VG692_07100 [Gemmatimonadales bacterium]|nr:hypothetical protein [Gemmatimonadales bacterium]HWA57002.1 hypothetical protein [Gemmatimonadales bacterium]